MYEVVPQDLGSETKRRTGVSAERAGAALVAPARLRTSGRYSQSFPTGRPSLGVSARARVCGLIAVLTARTLPSIITTIMPPGLMACRRVGSHCWTEGRDWIAVMYLDKPVWGL